MSEIMKIIDEDKKKKKNKDRKTEENKGGQEL